MEYPRWFQFERKASFFDSILRCGMPLGFWKNGSAISHEIKVFLERLSNSRRRKERFSSYIFIASVVRFAPPLNIPAEKDFRWEDFRSSQSPDALTVFTRISTANCSFSVYGTLKSFWRLCRMKNQLTRRHSLLTWIKPLMMYFLEMSGKLILLLVIPW